MYIQIPTKFIENFSYRDNNILNININSINSFMFRTKENPGKNTCNDGKQGSYTINRDGRILVLNMSNNNHIIIQTYHFFSGGKREEIDAYQEEFSKLYNKLQIFFNSKLIKLK